ncbi:MAG: sugar ABC transporter permease [Deltaproteobacteria bacterium]|nr:sugar ABC transporter permease [Deltaproteobacteria bacterium]
MVEFRHTWLALVSWVGAALVGGLLIDDRVERALDRVRGMRVELEARAALAGYLRRDPRVAFDTARTRTGLTIVREQASLKYHFLSRPHYAVNTLNRTKDGLALTPDDPVDLGRAERHAEARRKGVARLTRLDRDQDAKAGWWRATVATGTVTAELEANPPPVPFLRAIPLPLSRPFPPTSSGGSAPHFPLTFLFLWVLGAGVTSGLIFVRLARRSRGFAVVLSVVLLTAILGWAASRALSAAAVSATTYLQVASISPTAPTAPIALPFLGMGMTLAVFAAIVFASMMLWATPVGGGIRRALCRDRVPWLLALPAVLGMAVVVGVPFVVGLGLSFFRHRHGDYTFVGFSNFLEILSSAGRGFFQPESLPYALAMTVGWTVANVGLHLGFGLLFALLLQGCAPRFARIYRVILIVPWAVPAYITALIWKSMFDPDVGVVNRMLGLQGMSWMQSTPTAFLANLVTNVWLGFPFMMVVCLGALSSIPKDLYEAAELDGAGWFQRLTRITLPLLRPALLPAIILGSIWTFNRFEVIYLVSDGDPDGATEILVTEAYKWAFERGLAQGGAYGYAAAYSTIIFLVLLVYGWMTRRVARGAEEALR